MTSPINPPHYRDADLECIDAIRAMLTLEEFAAHCRASAVAYVWRAPEKGTPAIDCAKAAWYCQMAAHALAPDRFPDPRTYNV